ncbi:MAG: hypothetical protein COZ47_06565 [Lysobacterales bacterium CG_4_10_14_3_um_filter_64_11]|nr:MAG: hypothetical protein COZ47_06565 [Xanthomonadales bacterium CG_4_10_14_3_um_filter_64_11]
MRALSGSGLAQAQRLLLGSHAPAALAQPCAAAPTLLFRGVDVGSAALAPACEAFGSAPIILLDARPGCAYNFRFPLGP